MYLFTYNTYYKNKLDPILHKQINWYLNISRKLFNNNSA